MIVKLGELFIVDRPRRSFSDVEFWMEYKRWVDEQPESLRPLDISEYDVICMNERAAMMYELRWSGY